MISLSFPDVNVWLALATPEHVHGAAARLWWSKETGSIAFSLITQLGFLRLMTTAAAMDGKPLTMLAAWRVYERFFDDDRIAFFPESAEAQRYFREDTEVPHASPKLWVDSWLLALSRAAGGKVVTFDKALAARGALCLLTP